MSPKCSAGVLCGALGFMKAVMCLLEKIRLLNKLHSGLCEFFTVMNYSAIGQIQLNE